MPLSPPPKKRSRIMGLSPCTLPSCTTTTTTTTPDGSGDELELCSECSDWEEEAMEEDIHPKREHEEGDEAEDGKMRTFEGEEDEGMWRDKVECRQFLMRLKDKHVIKDSGVWEQLDQSEINEVIEMVRGHLGVSNEGDATCCDIPHRCPHLLEASSSASRRRRHGPTPEALSLRRSDPLPASSAMDIENCGSYLLWGNNEGERKHHNNDLNINIETHREGSVEINGKMIFWRLYNTKSFDSRSGPPDTLCLSVMPFPV